jgi:hypothetical protein
MKVRLRVDSQEDSIRLKVPCDAQIAVKSSAVYPVYPTSMRAIRLRVDGSESRIRLKAPCDAQIAVMSSYVHGGGAVYPVYAGDYEADARFSPQTFPTAMRTMVHDFEVHAINYTEAPNEYGVTVTIGG